MATKIIFNEKDGSNVSTLETEKDCEIIFQNNQIILVGDFVLDSPFTEMIVTNHK